MKTETRLKGMETQFKDDLLHFLQIPPLKTETRLKGMETFHPWVLHIASSISFENRDPLKGDGNK